MDTNDDPHRKPQPEPSKASRITQRLRIGAPEKAPSASEASARPVEVAARFAALGENPSDLICELDQGLRFAYVSANFRDILHYKPAGLLDRGLLEFLHEEDALAVSAELDKLMIHAGSCRLLFRFRNARGEWRCLESSAKAYCTATGGARAVLISRDVTERQQMDEQRALLASRDPSTLLFNKQYLIERLIEAVDAAQHHEPGALVYIDLDNFKQINDCCGHLAGDRLIVAVANLLHEATPKEGLLTRFGGDEFLVLFSKTGMDRAVRTAETMRECLAGYRFIENGNAFLLSASVGVVPVDGTLNSREVLNRANAACASAKTKGGNRVETLRANAGLDGFREAARRSEVLFTALSHGRVELWYQPVVHIPTGAVDHEEALIRLRAAGDDLHAPATFLPSAERFGHMEIVDRFVAESAIGYLARKPSGRVAVILSGHTFTKPDLTALILDRLGRLGVAPERLIVQIPWAVLLATLPSVREMLDRLKTAGVQLGIKYFRADSASVQYLRDFPVDYLKLDGELMRDFLGSTLNQATVSALNEIGHALHARTIAEFVDDQATLDRLRQIGIDYAKGYWLGMPKPPDRSSG